jgi:hypothetical protein
LFQAAELDHHDSMNLNFENRYDSEREGGFTPFNSKSSSETFKP